MVRTGKFAEAIDKLDEARRIFHRNFAGDANAHDAVRAEKFFDPEECKRLKPEQGRPIDWIFLALANRGMGNDQLARKWLQYTQATLQSHTAGTNDFGSNRRAWNDLELQLLLKEAVAAIPPN